MVDGSFTKYIGNNDFSKIILEIVQAENELKKAIRREENATLSGKIASGILRFGITGCFSLSAISGLISVFFGPFQWLGYTCVAFLVLNYLFLPVHMLFDTWNHRRKVQSFFRSPFSHLLRMNISSSLEISTCYLPRLMQCSNVTLEIGLMELKYARSDFEQRICVFVGPINSIGLFPGIVALITIISQQTKMEQQWMVGFAYANMLLLLMAGIAHQYLWRCDRMIALVELALNKKRQIKSGVHGAVSNTQALKTAQCSSEQVATECSDGEANNHPAPQDVNESSRLGGDAVKD